MENYNKFNHIKIHSQYSICEGALKIDELSNFCKKNKKIKALVYQILTNLCGALWNFQKIYLKVVHNQ